MGQSCSQSSSAPVAAAGSPSVANRSRGSTASPANWGTVRCRGRADEIPGPRCWCGQDGCIETWVPGTGFRRDYKAASSRDAVGEAIIEAARSGDTKAMAALGQLLDRLGRSMAMIGNLLDPDLFVIVGGLSNVPELLGGLPMAIRPHVFSDAWETPILPARRGDSSGARGGARL
jgi:fructokinase